METRSTVDVSVDKARYSHVANHGRNPATQCGRSLFVIGTSSVVNRGCEESSA